jgi:hypothetical protein
VKTKRAAASLESIARVAGIPFFCYDYPFTTTERKLETPREKEYDGRRKRVRRDEKSETRPKRAH